MDLLAGCAGSTEWQAARGDMRPVRKLIDLARNQQNVFPPNCAHLLRLLFTDSIRGLLFPIFGIASAGGKSTRCQF